MKTLLTTIAVYTFALTAKPLLACSCTGERTAEQAYNNSQNQIIVSGQVISVTKEEFIDSTDFKKKLSSGLPIENVRFGIHTYKKVLIKLDKVFKEDDEISSDTITIYTGSYGGDCGFYFTIGQNYIVYGTQQKNFSYFSFVPEGKNIYWTTHCHRTMEYSQQEADALVLAAANANSQRK